MSLIMFWISMLGVVLNSSNTLLILVCMELMLLSMILTIVICTLKHYSILGQTFALYIATVAAVESAMGLSMLMGFYKMSGSISLSIMNMLKG